jgi:hypothetical protein
VRFCKKRKGTLIRFWLGRAHQDVQTQPQRTDTNAVVRLRQVKACGGMVHEEHHDGTTTKCADDQCRVQPMHQPNRQGPDRGDLTHQTARVFSR